MNAIGERTGIDRPNAANCRGASDQRRAIEQLNRRARFSTAGKCWRRDVGDIVGVRRSAVACRSKIGAETVGADVSMVTTRAPEACAYISGNIGRLCRDAVRSR